MGAQMITTDAFRNWLPLRQLSLAHLSKHGDCAAVYGFRDHSTGEMLKFGNTGHLRNRMFRNYIGGVGGGTTQRIHAELFVSDMIDRVEVAWLQTEDKAQAVRKEKEFRAEYKKVVGRRPIWDRLD